MPRPRSLFRQHLPQLHLCSELLRHMLIGGHMTRFLFPCFFFFYFLIPPYVSMAHMTSLPSHPLYHDTISHFLTFFSLSKCKGMGRGNGTHSMHRQLLVWSYCTIYDETGIDFYSFFYLSSSRRQLLWTLQILQITLDRSQGAQVPGNFTPASLPSA